MSTFIGDACGGWSSTTPDTTVNEIRFVQSTRHDPISWNIVEMSLANRIKMIINVDSYGDGTNCGWHSEANLRTFTEAILNQLIHRAYMHGISYSQLKRFCRFTLDNEANEIYSPYSYGYYLDIFHSQVNGRFDIGAGNFGNNRKDYYEYICRVHQTSFNVLDIHMQAGWETKSKIRDNAKWYRELATKYGKRLSCTEANDTNNNIWTADGFDILHYQLKKAIEIGCEDFCMVFIKMDRDQPKYKKLSFIYRGQVNPYWETFKQMIKDNKPVPNIIEPIIMGDDDMILVTMKRGVKHPGVRWLQQILEEDYDVANDYGKYDGDFGAATERQVKAYQKKIGVEETGIIRATDVIKIYEESSEPAIWFKRLNVHASYQ